METTNLLNAISKLSNEFGSDTYVRGGGGNTSVKDSETLWIKPSGTSLAAIRPDQFLPLRRARIEELYTAAFPADAADRESAVKDFMDSAIVPGHDGRPSVEAPLHNLFPRRFVVHTHPAVVNGLTCGADGREAAARLFPTAMWIPFVEPGYTLTMKVRESLLTHEQRHGAIPDMVFLGNHGIFVAHDEPGRIRAMYNDVLEVLGAEVKAAGLEGVADRNPAPSASVAADVHARVRAVLGDEAKEIAVSGWFKVAGGPLSPDHIVYSKSWAYTDDLTPEGLAAFKKKLGYWPRVVATRDGVFGFGQSRKVADLALELAWDGALVERYAGAFGGVRYLAPHFVDFIENWEVENYRQKQSQ